MTHFQGRMQLEASAEKEIHRVGFCWIRGLDVVDIPLFAGKSCVDGHINDKNPGWTLESWWEMIVFTLPETNSLTFSSLKNHRRLEDTFPFGTFSGANS